MAASIGTLVYPRYRKNTKPKFRLRQAGLPVVPDHAHQAAAGHRMGQPSTDDPSRFHDGRSRRAAPGSLQAGLQLSDGRCHSVLIAEHIVGDGTERVVAGRHG
jgi:hypothetical protein